MDPHVLVIAIWFGGAIHVGLILANAFLPARLNVRERIASLPLFLRQVFVVHWIYIVLVLGFFTALCFGFAPELAGASRLGRFLSAFLAIFWFLRLLLQIFVYDPELRRQNRALDVLYLSSLTMLFVIFAAGALSPWLIRAWK